MGLVLHGADDQLQALREARRVARLGAAVLEWPFYKAEHGPPLAHRFKPEEIATLAQHAGFLRIEALPLSHLVLYQLTGGSSRKRGRIIPIDAVVQCTDGPGGRSTCVVLNPVTRRLSHVVVKQNTFPHLERLVPVEMVAETGPEQIHLTCSQQELHRLESFVETEFLPGAFLYAAYELDEYRLWPYVLPGDELVPVEHERVPPGELAVRRGSHVRATDGDVGRVDEFLVDRGTEHITHLVLREGHLWGEKDVLIPVSDGEIDEDRVNLTPSKEEVANLPTIPVRRWHEGLRDE